MFRLYYPMTDEELVERYEALQRVTAASRRIEVEVRDADGVRESWCAGNIVNTGRKASRCRQAAFIVWGLA